MLRQYGGGQPVQRHALRSHCHSQTQLMQLRCACKRVVVNLCSNCLLQARGASYLAVPEKLRQPRTGAQTLPGQTCQRSARCVDDAKADAAPKQRAAKTKAEVGSLNVSGSLTPEFVAVGHAGCGELLAHEAAAS
jgi:hypothetical protein